MELQITSPPAASLGSLLGSSQNSSQSSNPISDPQANPISAPADAQLRLHQAGQTLAYCSLWWTQTPTFQGHVTGLIGHFSASSAEAAQCLLDHACQQLSRQGCTLAVGPMDGSTWSSYRCVTQGSSAPPFWLEPQTPSGWPAWFQRAGFAAIATYASRICHHLDHHAHRLDAVSDRLAHLGVHLDTAANAEPEKLWCELHRLTLRCFQRQPFFQPISEAQFRALYAPLRAVLQADWLVLARHQDQLIGFLLAFPDRPPNSTRLILKTLAVLPERQYAGLGAVLVERCHHQARDRHFEAVIHALMHQDNASHALSRRYTESLRDYVLFGRSLDRSSRS